VTPGAGFTSGADLGMVAVTPDGERVFVTGSHVGTPFPGAPDGIAIFRRDPASGALTYVEAVLEEDAFPQSDGLSLPAAIAFTSDGRFAYLGANGDRSLTAFAILPFCPSTPRPSCRLPTTPGAASLVLRSFADPQRNSLQWKWRRGAATDASAFGDPSSDTDLAFCMHARSGAGWKTLVELTVPAGSTCASDASCWRGFGTPSGSKGWLYRDRTRANDGVSDVKLRPGPDGESVAKVAGRGSALGLPALPLAGVDEVSAQLVSGEDECWGAAFSAPFRANRARRLADSSD
jgi:hypothetical protein